MDTPRLAKDLSEYQDVLGQLAYKIYTPLCLCFPLQDSFSQSQIIGTLTKGLERLSATFPWLAGQVIVADAEEGNAVAGRPKIIPLDKTCRLIVKDFTYDADVPSIHTLRQARFPSSMLNGTKLTSMKGAPSSFGESEEGLLPVFFIQVNFINGGLILSFAGEHSIMDGQGLGQIIRVFSKACRNEPATDEEILQGNRARGNIVPLLDQATYKPGPELDHLLIKSGAPPPPANTSPLKCTWAYFHFPSSSLSKLKSLASSTVSTSNSPTVPYITTNDAISAFIWKSISHVRASHLPLQSTSTFARAVDIRPYLSIPPTYLGNMSSHTYNTLPLSSITTASLGSLASLLRSALKASDISYAARSLATHLSMTADKSSITYGADLEFSTDIFFSSWSGLPAYDVDFNLGLGFPESVRRPEFIAIEGLMYLMPMDRTCAIDALICLSDEDLEGLRGCREFGEYAEWIG